MLVLTRKKDEGFIISDNIKITIVDVSGDRIKIGIDAPSDIRIVRNELYDTEKLNIQASAYKPAPNLIKDIIAGNNLFKPNSKT